MRVLTQETVEYTPIYFCSDGLLRNWILGDFIFNLIMSIVDSKPVPVIPFHTKSKK